MKKISTVKLENLILIIFFFSIIVWSVSRCNDTKQEYADQDRMEDISPIPEEKLAENLEEKDPETGADITPKSSANSGVPPTPPPAYYNEPERVPSSASSTTTVQEVAGAKLYIVIDGLKLREGPALDSTVLAQLPLYEEVSFLNEVTDFRQRINLGKEEAFEPWVRVRTKDGKSGWVYGAGVNYYKKKREGVE